MGGTAGGPRPASIDFRMMRRAFLGRVRAGEVSMREARDAERDLVRAGLRYGVARRSPCPLCAQSTLCNVTYLFGPRLPKSGRCMTSPEELRGYERRVEQFTAYTVEVCTSCEWHHLLSAEPCGGARPQRRTRRAGAARAGTRHRRRA